MVKASLTSTLIKLWMITSYYVTLIPKLTFNRYHQPLNPIVGGDGKYCSSSLRSKDSRTDLILVHIPI